MLANKFDPRAYWESRLERMYTLEGVGYRGLGVGYNWWFYRVAAKVFRRAATSLEVNLADAKVLDVGSGTGFYIEQWKRLGAKSITGCDITSVAVERLRQRHAEIDFELFDIGSTSLKFPNPFDIVSAMAVLFHIVDDQRYQQALHNLYRLLRPGGYMLYSDNFLHKGRYEAMHHVSRSLREVEQMMLETGFTIISRRPMYVLMNYPVDSEAPFLRHTWRIIQRGCQARCGFVIGAVLYPLEVILTGMLAESPTLEIMICQKPYK